MTISKIDTMKIINCLKALQEECEKQGVKFNQYSESDLLEILYLYKAYRLSGEPSF